MFGHIIGIVLLCQLLIRLSTRGVFVLMVFADALDCRCLHRSLMEKPWMFGALESSPTSFSAATRPSTMRTMQTSSLRSSKVCHQCHDFEKLISHFLFIFRGVWVWLPLLGRHQRGSKRLHPLSHVCQRREQTDLPVSFLFFSIFALVGIISFFLWSSMFSFSHHPLFMIYHQCQLLL